MKQQKMRWIMVLTAAALSVALLLAGCADPAANGTPDLSRLGTTPKQNTETEPVNTQVTEPVETEVTEPVNTLGTVGFVLGDDGKIVGSPCDYGINFYVNGLTFTAAEYKANMETYIEQIYDMLADSVPYKQEKYLNGNVRAIFSSEESWGLLPGGVAFTAATGGQVIGYSADCGHPKDTSMVDFKMNGIALGDNVEKVLQCYGEPMWKSDFHCYDCWNGPDEEPDNGCTGWHYQYYFEDGSELWIRTLGEGEIVQLELLFP